MPDKLKIVAIGSGHLASHLIPSLHSIGCEITQVFSRSIYHANSLAHQVDAEAINSLAKVCDEADLYLIMVKDDVISDVCKQLPSLSGNQILAHTAGAREIDILDAASANYGSFYPLETFRKKHEKDLSEVPFLINGNNEHTKRSLRVLARKISSNVSECSDDDKLRYHISAVFINNFVNHLACLTHKYLDDNDLDIKYLDSIVRSGMDRILDHESCESQTGPAQRNDIQLIRKHLDLLKQDKNMSHIYKTLTDSIIELNKKRDEDS